MGYYSPGMLDPAIQHLIAIALAAIFAGSAAMKLYDLEAFEGAVANYRLLPRWSEKPAAWAIPIFESLCAAGILLPATRPVAARALVVLLGVLSGAVAINLGRGRRDIDCGCFGPMLRQKLGASLLARNLALIIAALLLELAPVARGLAPIDYVTIAFGAATLIVLYASANYAIANAPRTRALQAL
ncbi:MAG TPA: MauE/DoxX family redox-associated membrane protein [Candidatus Binataceae bacterium]|nr:MauE/DoxX family redox-associated membrane protein [Candidatus Binataceae bacterium]